MCIILIIDRYVPNDSGFGIYFDELSAEFTFGDEPLFLLAVTFG
jgi:hypothetical protein